MIRFGAPRVAGNLLRVASAGRVIAMLRRRLVDAFLLSHLVLLGTVSACADGTASDPSSAVAEPNGFSLMTWNLEWFYDNEVQDNRSDLSREKSAPSREAWDFRRDAAAASIAKARPTVVALQEVESRRILWYLSRAIERNHDAEYREFGIEGGDYFTEQDVGLLVRRPAEVLLTSRLFLTEEMRSAGELDNVSKHLLSVIQVPVGDRRERVTIMNVHLRARAEVEPVRIKQARSIHAWLREAILAGENVIVVGDLNTEHDADSIPPGSDLAVLMGRETPSTDDDLIDLHSQVPPQARSTHLFLDRQYDRILVSRSLMEDDPDRPDLCLQSIEVRPDLAIRGALDEPQRHWEHFWEIPEEERDLSDHVPVIATFTVR